MQHAANICKTAQGITLIWCVSLSDRELSLVHRMGRWSRAKVIAVRVEGSDGRSLSRYNQFDISSLLIETLRRNAMLYAQNAV